MSALIAIVSPMHNEASNIAALVDSLNSQTFRDFRWFIVDDQSTDGTSEAVRGSSPINVPRIVEKANDGGLIGGSAFSSWRRGIETPS